MDSLALGHPEGWTPGSTRKISHSEYVRAIAEADTPLRDSTNSTLIQARRSPAAWQSSTHADTVVKVAEEDGMQTPAKRRRSMRDRTPKQVQAILTERKRRMSASTIRKELTPGGLLRALSQMPDFPPPTPSEVDFNPDASAASSIDRRASYIRRLSSLAMVPEHSSPGFHHAEHHNLVAHDAYASLASPETSTTSSAAEVSALLLSSRRLSRSFLEGRRSVPLLSPAPEEQLRGSSRRDSLASVASVEHGRRAAPLAEDLSRFLVRRGLRKSELQADEDAAAGGDAPRYSLAASGRFSMGSEMGHSDLFFVQPELASPAGSNTAARLSLASGFADFSAARLSLPGSLVGDGTLERERAPTVDREEEEQPFLEQDFGGGFEDEEGASEHERFDDGGEDDEGHLDDRIPWADKGKGRAVDVYDASLEHDFAAVGDELDWAQAGSADGQGSEGPLALPSPPPLARTAENRQKRQLVSSAVDESSEPRKQRRNRRGEPVPDLPRAKQKSLFQHFLGPNVKMDADAVDALMDVSQDFFASMMEDASDAARRSGRTSTIREGDIVDAMHSHRLLNSRIPLSFLARQLGVDRELQSIVDRITLDLGKGGVPKRAIGRWRAQAESGSEEARRRKWARRSRS